jgi:hypothetical protein
MAETIFDKIPKFSNDELRAYLNDSAKYDSKVIGAVIEELNKRGIKIPKSELVAVEQTMADRTEMWRDKSDPESNLVDDPNAPELYLPRTIAGVSVLSSPIYGSIFFSMNLHRLGKIRYSIPVILFSVLWIAIIDFIIPENSKTIPFYLWNMIGGVILQYFFWPRFIGKDTKYRKRSGVVPYVIAIIINVVILGLFLLSN